MKHFKVKQRETKYTKRRTRLIYTAIDMLENEHGGCDQTTCDVAAAMNEGLYLWALELFSSSGAMSDELWNVYRQLKVKRASEAERKELIKVPHVECSSCGSIIWKPEECGYFCSNCGKESKPGVSK